MRRYTIISCHTCQGFLVGLFCWIQLVLRSLFSQIPVTWATVNRNRTVTLNEGRWEKPNFVIWSAYIQNCLSDTSQLIKSISTRLHSKHILSFCLDRVHHGFKDLIILDRPIDLLCVHFLAHSLYVFDGYLQLFRERLSEKVHATIPKGIVGGLECTVLQRNLKECHGILILRCYVCDC